MAQATMRTRLANWTIHHITERDVELRKDDPAWRKYTDQDGVVHVRAEPGMDRAKMIDRAYTLAEEADAMLSQKLAKELMPTGKQWSEYRRKSRQMAKVFGTGEERSVIGRKRA
jgi:hypothetical protein